MDGFEEKSTKKHSDAGFPVMPEKASKKGSRDYAAALSVRS